jgi:hypothetical protein
MQPTWLYYLQAAKHNTQKQTNKQTNKQSTSKCMDLQTIFTAGRIYLKATQSDIVNMRHKQNKK